MSIFKCKMCGGDLNIAAGEKVAECEYCGSKQTLPKLDDDRRVNLYDRANHFRRNNEFDKAMGIYEQILNEDKSDAEAYWSLVLCRYGIEYVEDPATHKRVPTVNRAQFTSVFDDDNYKSALQYADTLQKEVYENEAKAINEIQKGILAISHKEEPFDVFICYKETDANGRRTPDSVLANDLYHQLTQEGFKVFFSRITLEDKLGTAYEPYIFAALNSAKVMVVLGTKPEHFNAVWVKNEWSRYLALVKQSGGRKVLIPAYKDMDPYDLPEEFSHLQAQDMSKLGFMQDLLRGIKKLATASAPKQTVKETVVVGTSNAGVAPLLKRAFMFLEDGDWQQADEYCEKVLDQDPENAQAYLGKLMAELRARKQEDLADCKGPFDGRNSYQKALRFGDEKFITTIKGYITHINERNENARLTQLYNKAYSAMQAADSEERYLSAAQEFKAISGFQDADALVKQCTEKAEACRVERLTGLYDQAVSAMQKAAREDEFMSAAAAFQNLSGFRDADALAQKCLDSAQDSVYSSAKAFLAEDTVDGCEMAEHFFRRIPGWKDADEQLQISRKRIDELKAKEEAERIAREQKKKEAQLALIRKLEEEKAERERKEKEARALAAKKRKKILAIVAVIAAVCIAAAVLLIFVIIPNNKYSAAMELYKNGAYQDAIAAFEAMDGYKDSVDMIAKCKYDAAADAFENNNVIDAFERWASLEDYEDSAERAAEIFEQYKAEKLKNASVGDILYWGTYEQDGIAENGREPIEWIVLEKSEHAVFVISKYVIDRRQFHTSWVYVTWDECALRKWLNADFINDAFDQEEQERILSSSVSADYNPLHSASPGSDTTDKVFLLSIKELNKYFSTNNDRICVPTEYVVSLGLSDETACAWWLRTAGEFGHEAAAVNTDGNIAYTGRVVDSESGLRPVMWISTD